MGTLPLFSCIVGNIPLLVLPVAGRSCFTQSQRGQPPTLPLGDTRERMRFMEEQEITVSEYDLAWLAGGLISEILLNDEQIDDDGEGLS